METLSEAAGIGIGCPVKTEPVPIDRNLSHTLDVIRFLFEPGDVIEIRGIGVGRTASFAGCITSGYFNLENTPAIVNAIRKLDGHAEGVYVVLNRLNPDLLARANNRLQARPKNTTSDQDILERRWLYIDCDSVRPAGISSTDVEHQAALARASEIHQFLESLGWPEGFRADSGNGGHLLYRLPVLDPVKADDCVRRALQSLNARFSDDKVLVDVTTCNRARIIKLYGTLTKKGDHTPARPHRRAMGLQGPDRAEPVPFDLLDALAAQSPEAARPKPSEPEYRGAGKSSFGIDAWLANSGLEIFSGPEPYSGGRRWLLRSCPFASDKPHDKPAVLQLPSGALVYKCLHKSCEDKNWEAIRNFVEPNRPRGTYTESSTRKREPGTTQQQPSVATESLTVYDVASLLALEVPPPRELVEGLIPFGGASLIVAKPKAGKTVFAVQAALAVASGRPLFDYYRVLEPGPVMVIEQDDPAGPASVKDILSKSPIPVAGIPFYLVPKVPFYFGTQLLEWLETQITDRGLRMIVLDSYTALRASRSAGCDLVKTEQTDLVMLDELAKKTGCTIVIIHHGSKGSAALEWDQQAAGSFAMAAAVESQIHISRFTEIEGNAPERLVRVQGRHLAGAEFVLRFRRESIDYEHVLEGPAASVYPLIRQIRAAFGGQPFSPKDVAEQIGVSRATAHRQIVKLYTADVITKRGYGEYVLAGSDTTA